jgi:3-octaprenyl-4-hydroxybenzoate carboxy-lyase
MPIALAIGVEPGLPFVGGMPLPEGADESHYLGALFGEGIEVIPTETVDLLVPATRRNGHRGPHQSRRNRAGGSDERRRDPVPAA